MGRRALRIAALLALAIPLGGCLPDASGSREAVGALGGAVGGAFVGKDIGGGSGQVLATAAGTLIGAAVGADIGRTFDLANRGYEARLSRRVGHSQQTPVPGFVTAPPGGSSWFGSPAGADTGAQRTGAIREAHACRPLEGGLKPAFACWNDAGQWFVLQ